MMRLFTKADLLRAIFNTFVITLPSILNIGLLLLLVLFIYTILGMELFAYTQLQNYINNDVNYTTFGKSILTLFRSATGEGWNFIMDDMLRTIQPNYICNDVTDWETYNIYGQTGCGRTSAYVYMMSF